MSGKALAVNVYMQSLLVINSNRYIDLCHGLASTGREVLRMIARRTFLPNRHSCTYTGPPLMHTLQEALANF